LLMCFLSSSVNVMSRVLSSSVSSAVWTLRIATPLACHVALLRSLRCRFFWVIARVLKKVWTYPLGRPVQRLIFLKKTRSFFEALRFWVHVFGAFYNVTPSKASRRLESKNLDAEMSSPMPFRRLVLMQNSLARCETGLGSNGLN